jgi:hypothetical protein
MTFGNRTRHNSVATTVRRHECYLAAASARENEAYFTRENDALLAFAGHIADVHFE